MYNDFYNPNLISNNTLDIDSTWIIISAVLALIGGIVAYILFVSKKKNEYKGFVGWLHDFLNFKVYFIDMILKVLYLIITIFITLSSFSFIRISIASFFVWLILGNVVVRIGYEFILMFLTLVNNTSEINKKLGTPKKESTPAPKSKKTDNKDDEE